MHSRVLVASTLIAVAILVALGASRSQLGTHPAIASSRAAIPACDLDLPPPRSGEPRFAVPAGGRALARMLAGRIRLCTLFRADGTRFANLQVDELRQVLEVRFFRRSGRLLFAADAGYPAKAQAEGSDVSCKSDSSSSIGGRYWTKTYAWQVGKTPSKFARKDVIQALRSAFSEWTNNIDYCGLVDNAKAMAQFEGDTSRKAGHDGANTVDWGSLDNVQTCEAALACAATWYGVEGNPIESDVRFNADSPWALKPNANQYDIQSAAAHEFGHVRQFGHVTNAKQNDETVVMWPYITIGDTSGRKLGRGDALANNKHY